ncbi:MAG: competence/damage-inducible protein CinA [Fibrobacteres bacterium]|nr:competence/damage-inducible protein CinA [Fibrobacterota bacterium]
MRVGIINIGDELLGGKILNSNQFDLARILAPLGHEIPFNLVIGDDEKVLARALDWAMGPQALVKPDMLILTGGLGPTRDDLTRQAVAGFLKRPVVESPEAMEWLAEYLAGYFGKPAAEMPWGQRIQASIPEGTRPLRNPVGTACGFAFEAHGIPAFAFPGVPSELDAMVRLHLLPGLQGDGVLLEKTVWTWGWSESAQRQAFAPLTVPDHFRYSSLPGERGVRLTLSCLCAPSDRDRRGAELDLLWREMLNAIPSEAIVDREGATLPQAVVKLLLAKKATVSVAESCTGGGLGFLLTETSGSSEVFHRGFLTYSNQAKSDLLGVDAAVLKSSGAVSEETALAMVRGCLEKSGATYAVAITGVAGPTGGTPEKPVGTVWIAVASREFAKARLFKLRGDRNTIRWRSAYNALNQLRLLISGQIAQ